MGTEENRLKRLIKDIFATRDDEIQCRDAAELIARCSDALLTDEEVQRRYPQLWHHFGLCPDCAEEYRAVMALAREEAEGRLPQSQPLPPIPAESEALIQPDTKDTRALLFSGFSPAITVALTRGEEQIVEPVTVAFPRDHVSVTLDVAPAADPQRRDLYCTVTTESDRPTQSLEGAPIWLQVSEHQTVVAEQTLDDFGDALFEAIAPDTYDLRLYLAGKEYRIAQIDIP